MKKKITSSSTKKNKVRKDLNEFAEKRNTCFVTVQGFANEMYGKDNLSVYMKAYEDMVQIYSGGSKITPNFLGGNVPQTPEVPSNQNTKDAAISVIKQVYKQNSKCPRVVFTCHSKGSATCFNLGAKDVINDKSISNEEREFMIKKVVAINLDGGVNTGGSPIADIALAYCEQDTTCQKHLDGSGLTTQGRKQRAKVLAAWEEFKKKKSAEDLKLLDKSFFILDKAVAKTATKLTIDGMVSLSSEYVNKRVKQIDYLENPLRDKTNIQTSVKKSSDYLANNPTRIFAEFMEIQGLNGDGLVPCKYQVAPKGFGTWTLDTQNMWHMESNAAGPVSGSEQICRENYAARVYQRTMDMETVGVLANKPKPSTGSGASTDVAGQSHETSQAD